MKLYKNKCINDNIVIIDGLTRSGKFYLGKLLSSIKGLEYFINSSEIERIIAIGKAGTLGQEDASALMTLAINEEIYNRAIGRNMNLRPDDGSSILHSYEKDKYFSRQENEPGWMAVKKVIDANRYSVFILHHSLQAIDIVKGAISKPYIVNIRRHPIDLAYSWLKRGWGDRYGNDLLTFGPVYQLADAAVPYFAIDWAHEYLGGDKYDRVVRSIIYLTEIESAVIDNGEHDICCVYYDNLVYEPKKEIDRICVFLNREPHESLSDIIKRETRDTNLISDRGGKENHIYDNIKNKALFKRLIDLGASYERSMASCAKNSDR